MGADLDSQDVRGIEPLCKCAVVGDGDDCAAEFLHALIHLLKSTLHIHATLLNKSWCLQPYQCGGQYLPHAAELIKQSCDECLTENGN